MMDQDDKTDKKAQAPNVGYKKPPRHAQFKKGHKGHGGGRRKRADSDSSPIAAVLSQTITATVNGKRKKVPLTEAFAMNIAHKAMQGDKEASRILASWIREDEKKRPPGRSPLEIEARKRAAEQLAAFVKRFSDMFAARNQIFWYMLGYVENDEFRLFHWVKVAAMQRPEWLAVHLRPNAVEPDPPHIVERMKKLLNKHFE